MKGVGVFGGLGFCVLGVCGLCVEDVDFFVGSWVEVGLSCCFFGFCRGSFVNFGLFWLFWREGCGYV